MGTGPEDGSCPVGWVPAPEDGYLPRRMGTGPGKEAFMFKSILIKDTTREERMEIIRQSLSWCGGGCENCSSCWLGGGKADDIYRPYIDGEKEISEINKEYRANFQHG